MRGVFAGRDKGTVAVTFLLSLPILLLVIGIFVQFALLVNARLTIARALDAAGRSAMVSVPTNGVTEGVDAQGNAMKSACMVLAGLSPAATGAASPTAVEVAEALRTVGMAISPGYENRYTFAEGATVLTLSAAQDPANRGTECTVTMEYPFRLNVPGANAVVGTPGNYGGVAGRYYLFRVSRTVRLSAGREVLVDNAGGAR